MAGRRATSKGSHRRRSGLNGRPSVSGSPTNTRADVDGEPGDMGEAARVLVPKPPRSAQDS